MTQIIGRTHIEHDIDQWVADMRRRIFARGRCLVIGWRAKHAIPVSSCGLVNAEVRVSRMHCAAERASSSKDLVIGAASRMWT